MKIKVLSDTVINQIAAGEVVERPSSVVRELVDNAVDAGAKDICVTLEAGGHSRMRVRDDGCGMTRDEAILAFERHATSKVSAIEDLLNLATLGFRGEALASIAAVSKVKLITRSREAEVGTSITFRGGKLIDVQSCAWNEGTEIEVEHLFFNTPARRKFLKSPRAELARIRTWLMQSSLGRFDVRYRLISDGDEVLNLARARSIAERGAQVCAGDLMPVALEEGGISVTGMVGHPGQALADSTGLSILINGRLVSDKLVVRAVREGYDSMLKDREFPVGYISLALLAEDVDVNVHPQKSEVRFRHPNQIFAVVRGAVLAAVRGIRQPMSFAAATVGNMATPPVLIYQGAVVGSPQPLVFEAPSSLEAPRSLKDMVREVFPDPPRSLLASGQPVQRQPSFFKLEAPEGYANPNRYSSPHNTGPFRFSDMRYVGQVLECYLICELNDKLVVLDMHAAHERVNYNKIRRARAEHTLQVQKLLIPEVVQLTEEQVTVIMEQEDALKALAFEVEQLSSDTVRVCGVPGIISHLRPASLIKEFAVEPVIAGWRERLDERIDHMVARIACHASVRSGDTMSRPEAYARFVQLDDAELSAACPHGRPVVTEFSRDGVERWFGRDR